MEAEAAGTNLFGTLVSNIQDDDIVITEGSPEGSITGTLRYLDTGAIANRWGDGNFIALKFSNLDPDAESVKVGLEPSQSSGLVEIINDPDKNGVFKVTNKDTQKFKVVQSGNGYEKVQLYDLSGLTLEEE